jgi:hypothetical protein
MVGVPLETGAHHFCSCIPRTDWHIERVMKITLPEGFKMPATAKPNEPFEAVATLVMGDDGVMLTAIDGLALAEEVEEMEEEEYADPEITLPFGESEMA